MTNELEESNSNIEKAIVGETVSGPVSRIERAIKDALNAAGSNMTEEKVKNIVQESVADVVADSPEEFDTLKEISDWINKYEIVIDNKQDIISSATTSAAGLMSAADKTKLNGIATGAEVNQNAFSNVTVGSTTIAADGKTDTLTIAAGSNVTLTTDTATRTVTITSKNTTYDFSGLQSRVKTLETKVAALESSSSETIGQGTGTAGG